MNSALPKAQLNHERLMQILLRPHISEKSTIMSEQHRQFAFKVLPDANKTEIKQAVELLFGVQVTAVQISNVKSKLRRFKQIVGRKKAWKKAYISLAEGHDIDFTGTK